MTRTVVVVTPPRADGARPTVRVETDGPRGRAHLAVRFLPPRGPVARVALVAEGALLLAGDEVEVHVQLRRGAALEVVEPAGTVAYDMRGGRASWQVEVVAGEASSLLWRGEAFVVAGGADVARSTHVRLATGAVVTLREQLVLGRTGEPGGRLRSSTRVEREGSPLHLEDLVLDGGAPVVGVLGGVGGLRVIETLSTLGWRAPGIRLEPPAHRLDLEGEATLLRTMTAAAHEGALDGVWHDVCASLVAREQDLTRREGRDDDAAARLGDGPGASAAPRGRVLRGDVAQQH